MCTVFLQEKTFFFLLVLFFFQFHAPVFALDNGLITKTKGFKSIFE